MLALHSRRIKNIGRVLPAVPTGNFSSKNDKDDFSPFSVGLNKKPSNEGTLSKLMGFFKKSKGSTLTGAKSGTEHADKAFKMGGYQQKLKKENQKLDDFAEPETQKQILALIEKSISREHFNEKRVDAFFEKCFSLQDPRKFKRENERFFRWVYDDLKVIVQCCDDPENLVEFTKFVVFFGAEDDPEIMDLLTDQVLRSMRRLGTDSVLEIVVNFAVTLSPNAQDVFDAANQEFGQRLRHEYYDYKSIGDLFVKPEDLIKILNVLLDHKQLQPGLKEQIIETMRDQRKDYTYDLMAEIAVIFATKMDPKYRAEYFNNFLQKFQNDIEYLKEETLYKILWSFIKAERLVVREDAYDWFRIRQSIQKKAKDMSPKILTNILVLSTQAKDHEFKMEEVGQSDFWDSMEPIMILKMAGMDLEDLINLMWSAMEVDRGSNTFYTELESELTKRMLKIKDEEFQTLLTCFTKEGNSMQQMGFSEKFMSLVIRVIQEKKDRFQLRTLVHIIWALAKMEFSNSEKVIEALKDLKEYDRLVIGLEGMYQKSQCILLWTYSRHEELLDKEFLTKVINSMLGYQGQVFQLDNFDILLILQAASHLERSPEVSQVEDLSFLAKIHQLTHMIDTFVFKNLERMNLHEYTTSVIYYLNHPDVCSDDLRRALLEKMQTSIPEFNEYQLHIFQKLISKVEQDNLANLVEEITIQIGTELEGLQKEKVLLAAEDKLRHEIRRRLTEAMEKKKVASRVEKVVKMSGTKEDQKLEGYAAKKGSEQQPPETEEEPVEEQGPDEGPEEDIRSKLFQSKQPPKADPEAQQEQPAPETKEDAKPEKGSNLLKRYLKNKTKS